MRNVLAFMAVVSLAILPACSNPAKTHVTEVKSEQVQRLKDYSFCACLRTCMPKNDSLLIKDGSSAGYFEKSSYGQSVFERIDSLAQNGGLAVYKSKAGKPLCIMKCLDFYNSSSLDSLLQVISREKKP
jgi:hypothetical protein